jgi:hypothetical protein
MTFLFGQSQHERIEWCAFGLKIPASRAEVHATTDGGGQE